MTFILYDPIEGDVVQKRIKLQPRTCFIMTKLGTSKDMPHDIKNMRLTIEKYLKEKRFRVIDANHKITGKDFLLKIWELIVSVPVGVAILSDGIDEATKENIFFELGLMHALGKTTVVVKKAGTEVPSDFVRTEYIDYNRKFGEKFKKFITTVLEQDEYYKKMAETFGDKSPLVAIDYLRRAYLISGKKEFRKKIKTIITNSGKFLWDQHFSNCVVEHR